MSIIKREKIDLKTLSKEDLDSIKEFESLYKGRKAIWRGRFTFRYIGWKEAPICDECGKKMKFEYTRNDCCLNRKYHLNWHCKTCSRGATSEDLYD